MVNEYDIDLLHATLHKVQQFCFRTIMMHSYWFISCHLTVANLIFARRERERLTLSLDRSKFNTCLEGERLSPTKCYLQKLF